VYLKQVATVQTAPRKSSARTASATDRRIPASGRPTEVPAVIVSVAKRAGTNAVTVAEETLRELARIRPR
jgi:multidrug efflux pump subunit AcrB